jgi:hypothetical protein
MCALGAGIGLAIDAMKAWPVIFVVRRAPEAGVVSAAASAAAMTRCSRLAEG